MTAVERKTDIHGAAVGSTIGAAFGIAWGLWGASGLSGSAAVAVRVASVVVGVVILVRAIRLRHATVSNGRSLFAEPSYRIVVAVEVAALVAGSALLGSTGHREYVCAWCAAVVGVHFLAFGRLFDRSFYLLGALILLGAAVATALGVSGHGASAVLATAGLVSAASLFAVAGWRTFSSAP